MRRRASYNMWVPTRTEKSWRTARIKFARGHQLQQAFRIQIKRLVSSYSFALFIYWSFFYASPKHTYYYKGNKVKCASYMYGCSGCYVTTFLLKQKLVVVFSSCILNFCVKYVHAQFEFAIIIGILYIGILYFNILLVYYSGFIPPKKKSVPFRC